MHSASFAVQNRLIKGNDRSTSGKMVFIFALMQTSEATHDRREQKANHKNRGWAPQEYFTTGTNSLRSCRLAPLRAKITADGLRTPLKSSKPGRTPRTLSHSVRSALLPPLRVLLRPTQGAQTPRILAGGAQVRPRRRSLQGRIRCWAPRDCPSA